MKRIILSLVAIVTLSLSTFGQAPEGFKYQAVVRDAGGLILNNQAVGLRLTVQQGSIGGTAVYTETFATTTNAYGLVNLEIGTGTTADDFTMIDWSNGPYFMESAVDFLGGMTWVVMGTSQLMSVPYALHSKTAENVTNDSVDDADNDPSNELQTISRNGTTVTLTNGGSFEDSIVEYTAGAGIDITNNVISSTSSSLNLAIGDTYGGGIVFYIDASGEHGLICQLADLSTGEEWGTGFTSNSLATGYYSGAMNTKKIIYNAALMSQTCPAATICDNLVEGGFDDWYLPSRDELDLMYVNLYLQGIGGFSLDYYWSSTRDYTSTYAWSVRFQFGTLQLENASWSHSVRAVRAF